MNQYAFWWTSVFQSWRFHPKVTVTIISTTHNKIMMSAIIVIYNPYAPICHRKSVCWKKQLFYHYRLLFKRAFHYKPKLCIENGQNCCQLIIALLRARLGSNSDFLAGTKNADFLLFSDNVVNSRPTAALSFYEILYYLQTSSNFRQPPYVAKSFRDFIVFFHRGIALNYLLKATFDDPSVITVDICHHFNSFLWSHSLKLCLV